MRNMQNLTLDQFRTVTEAGGLLSVSLVAQGGSFHVEAETRKGQAVLVKSRGETLREFRNPAKAMLLLRDLGVREMRTDTRQWNPEQAELGKYSRPDRTKAMNDALDAADLKRTLEARIKAADDPNTVWHDHDQVFNEIEASLAN
jgi:hypothetical protein